MFAGFTIVVIFVIVAVLHCASAWMQSTMTESKLRATPMKTSNHVSLRSASFTTLNAEKPETANGEGADADKTPTVEWGVSYIGGDPCGSKYNTDPFYKNPSDKPGMPDDMKARIEALAQKRLQEELERNAQ